MYEPNLINIVNVGKMYKVFNRKIDYLIDGLNESLAINRWLPLRRANYQEFWALRGISLSLPAGKRIGIIGRNGAGKSTLLKLITGNITSTEGTIEVNGKIQALLECGAGFHPEFTGYENMKASLVYQGLKNAEIGEAIESIAKFTELGKFLHQPFKTYSAGMQARLTFATATAIRPQILIVDEILGAGDAYFFGKCQERMQELVEKSGASVLLVSHAMDQITRFCEEAIWIERGKIIKRGKTFDIVDSYIAFTQLLEDRRLKAKNMKVRSGNCADSGMNTYADNILLILELNGSNGDTCDVKEISLIHDQIIEETIAVGDAQDANTFQSSYISLEGSDWSKPITSDDGCWRQLCIHSYQKGVSVGHAVFYSYGFLEGAYSLRLRYRSSGGASLFVTVVKNDIVTIQTQELLIKKEVWVDAEIMMVGLTRKEADQESTEIDKTIYTNDCEKDKSAHGSDDKKEKIRWPSEGSLIIRNVKLLDRNKEERAVFKVLTPLSVEMSIVSKRSGNFNILPTATLYRDDGVFVSNFIGDVFTVDMRYGDLVECTLIMDSLNLGNGYYSFSVAIYENAVSDESRYDLISRSYEFQVVGNETLHAHSVFCHPSKWCFKRDCLSS